MIILAFAVLSPTAAMASLPCTPPVCDPAAANGKQCAAKADWIVEGTIAEVTEQHGPFCDLLGCNSLWLGNVVTLAHTDAKVVKGQVKAKGSSRPNAYATASRCFGRLVKIEPAMIGQRVRVFGTDKPVGPNTGSGIFAYELVSPSLGGGTSAAAEERLCPPPPCDLKKDGRATCEARATWIIEGNVDGLEDRFARACAQFGDLRECMPPGWTDATVHLHAVKAIKMPMSVVVDGPPILSGYGKATLSTANQCWEAAVRIPAHRANSRVRVYGMDKFQDLPRQFHGWGPYPSRQGGYFAYEILK